MNYQSIIYQKKEGLVYLTLNRPRTGNLVDDGLVAELARACQQVNEDEEARAVILTGAGDAFSLGQDTAWLSQLEKAGPDTMGLKGWSPAALASKAITGLNMPSIAAINGDAVGAGLELALACDLRVAAEGARLGFPDIPQGLIPSGGGTQRLPRLVGRDRALEMLLTAEPVDVAEAFRIGLVNLVVARPQVMAAAEKLAQRILSRGPIAVRYAKEAVHKGLEMTLEQGLRLEADLSFILQTTKDRAEGIKAFLEKRPPQFKGE